MARTRTMLHFTDSEIREYFCRNEINREAIRIYADCNMNRVQAARTIGIHYASLTHRFDRIEDHTALDPRCFYDLCKLIDIIGRE